MECMKMLVPRPSSTPIWEQGSIALWESTLFTVFELVVDNIPLRDGNWSLTLKGRVLEYGGNMGSMSNDSRKLRKTFR